MSTFQRIFTHKNISKALWDNYIHTLPNGRNIVELFIFMDLDPYAYYFMVIHHESISKALWDIDFNTIQKGRKCCVDSSYLWR